MGGGGNILPAMLPVEKSLLHHSLSPCLRFNPTSMLTMMALQLPAGGVSPGSLFFIYFFSALLLMWLYLNALQRT